MRLHLKKKGIKSLLFYFFKLLGFLSLCVYLCVFCVYVCMSVFFWFFFFLVVRVWGYVVSLGRVCVCLNAVSDAHVCMAVEPFSEPRNPTRLNSHYWKFLNTFIIFPPT